MEILFRKCFKLYTGASESVLKFGRNFYVKYATNVPRSFEDGEQNGFLSRPRRELRPLKPGPKPQQLFWRLFGGRTWCRNTTGDKLPDTCVKTKSFSGFFVLFV